jgi:uncharacterized protein YuzE
MRDPSTFRAVYDDDADVLYITQPGVAAERGVEDQNGIIWRYDAMGHLVGATVIGMKDRWTDDRSGLATVLTEIVGPRNAVAYVTSAFAAAVA